VFDLLTFQLSIIEVCLFPGSQQQQIAFEAQINHLFGRRVKPDNHFVSLKLKFSGAMNSVIYQKIQSAVEL